VVPKLCSKNLICEVFLWWNMQKQFSISFLIRICRIQFVLKCWNFHSYFPKTIQCNWHYEPKLNSVAWVRERTIPSDHLLQSKLVPTLADREFYVVSVTDPFVRNLGFLDRNWYMSRPSYRLLSAKLVPSLLIEGATWSAWRIPMAVMSVF
jgi:hypothetical protein